MVPASLPLIRAGGTQREILLCEAVSMATLTMKNLRGNDALIFMKAFSLNALGGAAKNDQPQRRQDRPTVVFWWGQSPPKVGILERPAEGWVTNLKVPRERAPKFNPR